MHNGYERRDMGGPELTLDQMGYVRKIVEIVHAPLEIFVEKTGMTYWITEYGNPNAGALDVTSWSIDKQVKFPEISTHITALNQSLQSTIRINGMPSHFTPVK